MKIIIPVGGRGTRVRPHTHSKSKSLVKIANKAIIEHLLNHLITLNPEEIFIVHDKFNREVYKNFLTKVYPNLKFTFVLQEEPLGTAHVVLQVKPFIKEGDEVLVNFCDTLFVKDLSCISELKQNNDGVIFVQEVENYQRFGVIVHENRIMKQIVEKPSTPISKLANIGTYYIKDGFSFMKYVERVIEEDKRVKGEWYLTEAFSMMIEDGKKLWVEDIDDWQDVGKIETILETHAKILNGGVVKGENVILENTILGKNVSIGNNVKLVNCNVEGSIIGDDVNLKGLEIKDSIIGDRVSLTKEGNKFNIGDDCYIS